MGPFPCHCCREVFEKLNSCGSCGLTHYCSRSCQRTDWPSHKADCHFSLKKKQQESGTDNEWKDIPKFSVQKLIGTTQEQADEYARLIPALSTLGCVVLTDLPDFAAAYYQDLAQAGSKLIEKAYFDAHPTNREVEPRSYIYPCDTLPFVGTSRRFMPFATDLAEHMGRIIVQVFVGNDKLEEYMDTASDHRQELGAIAYTKPSPKPVTLRQDAHFDGGLLSIVCPIPTKAVVSAETTGNSTSSGIEMKKLPPGLQCFNPDKKIFQPIPLQKGELVLLAGRDLDYVSRGWIRPGAHRVVTQANQPERLSFITTSEITGQNHVVRKAASLADLKTPRNLGMPYQLTEKGVLGSSNPLWTKAELQVEDLDWLLPPTDTERLTFWRLVDVMCEDGDENVKIIDLDDKPRDWSKK